MTADLFAASGQPPVTYDPPDFVPAFLDDLEHLGDGTASETRERHGIAGDNSVGADVRALARDGVIRAVGYKSAVGRESNGHIERIWTLTGKAPKEKKRKDGRA